MTDDDRKDINRRGYGVGGWCDGCSAPHLVTHIDENRLMVRCRNCDPPDYEYTAFGRSRYARPYNDGTRPEETK